MRKYLTKKELAVVLFLKLVHKLQRSEKELFDYLEQRLSGTTTFMCNSFIGGEKQREIQQLQDEQERNFSVIQNF